MKTARALAALILLAVFVAVPAFAATTPSVNPNVPAQNSPLQSSTLRAQFSALYNDLTTIFNAIYLGANQTLGSVAGGNATALSMPSCASGALSWTPGLGYGCNAISGSSGITSLVGDVTASGPGAASTALANTATARNDIGLGAASAPTFAGAKFSLNAAALPTKQTGTLLQSGNADGVVSREEIDSFAAAGHFSAVRSDGTAAAPTALLAADSVGSFNVFGHNGTAIVGPQGAIRCFANQNWSVGANGTYCDIATTPNGSATLTSVLRFENDGGITTPGVTGGDEGIGTINVAGLFVNGVSVGAGGGATLSSLTAATTTHSIDSAANAQTWAWGTLSTQTGLTLTSSSLTTGKVLDVENTSGANTSGYAGYFANATTGAGYAIAATTTGASNTGVAAYFVDNSTTGFALETSGIYKALNATDTGAVTIDPVNGGSGPKVHWADKNGHTLDNSVFVGSTFQDLNTGDATVAASSTLNLLGGGTAAIKFSYNNWTEAARVVNSTGDFLIGTTSDLARLTVAGAVNSWGLISSAGTKFTTTGCSVSSTTGGASAGTFTLGANTCSVVITLNGATGETAPHGWFCNANDQTAPTVLISQSSNTTATATLNIPAGAGATDVIVFGCVGF